MPCSAVLFDAYGTLLDVYSVAQAADRLFPGQGAPLARLWRDKQIDYTRLVSMSGRAQPEAADGPGSPHYQPFSALTLAALRFSCASLQLALTPEGEAQLMGAYRHLQPYPENIAVLQALRAAGIATGILSNGDPAMLDDAVQNAGLQPLLDHVLSVHATRRFKTDPAAYALGPAALGRPAQDILFVSSNGWDAIGATWFGYSTLWVNRAGLPLDPLGVQPTHTGHSLRDVLPLLGLS